MSNSCAPVSRVGFTAVGVPRQSKCAGPYKVRGFGYADYFSPYFLYVTTKNIK
jgi:hypothetical protein